MTVVINTPVRTPSYATLHPTPGTAVELAGNEDFLNAVLGTPKRFHYSSRTKLHVVNMPVQAYERTRNGALYEAPTVSLAIQAIHQAFAAHVPLSLRPDTLWYFIVHQVAEYVRQNPAECAKLFTDTPDSKQTILVRDDNLRYDEPSGWQQSIGLVRGPLTAKIGTRASQLFLPDFSTSTDEDAVALLIALMDAASPYYMFEWQTMCGIPQIRLEGTPSDWHKLCNCTDLLACEFDGLRGYFEDLLPVLQTIAETANGTTPDEEFWRSVYKYGGGSGGPFVNGWITAFFAYIQTEEGPVIKERFNWRQESGHWGGYRTNKFPSHVTKVPFIWDYFGTRLKMAFVAGVTGVDYDDTFLSPQLGFAVVEV